MTQVHSAEQLVRVGRRFDERGWVMGTSGNFSVVIGRDPLRLAITPSAAFKGELQADQILEMDDRGAPVDAPLPLGPASTRPRVSAEALLHLEIVRARGAGAVLHTHSIWATLLSERFAGARGFFIEGYEMLKGLEGVRTHEHREWLPIVENDQDMARLSGVVRGVLERAPGGAWIPAAPARTLHLGDRFAPGRPPRRDSGVLVGGRWERLSAFSRQLSAQVPDS